MSDTQTQLNQAYELIQQENDDAALDILRPIVQADPQNVDAWWLITYATDDPREARRALVHVLKNRPEHTDARTNLQQLNEIAPPTPDEEKLLAEVPPIPKTRKTIGALDDLLQDEFTDEDDLFADVLEETSDAPQPVEKDEGGLSTVTQILMGLVAVIMAIVLGTVLLNEQAGDKGQEDLAALEAGGAVDTLANLDLGEGHSPIFAETDLGKTLFVQTCVCTTADCTGATPAQLPDVALSSIQMAADQVMSANAQADVPGVGVEITACNNNDDTLYRGYIATATVDSSLDWARLQAIWTVES